MAYSSTSRYPANGLPVAPRHILGVADHATEAEIEAAFKWLVSRERELPTNGGYSRRIARLAAAREALLNLDDGL